MKKLQLLPRAFAAAATTFLLFSCQPRPSGGVLENTRWTLVSIMQNSQSASIGQDAKVTAAFSAGKVSGSAPCNTYSGAVSLDGVKLTVADVLSTERMCDQMDLEMSYLGLLAKAQAYTARKDRLEIFCEGGRMLAFAPMSEQEVEKASHEAAMSKLDAYFPEWKTTNAPHLYPLLKVDNPGSYPFVGTLVDTSFYQHFDEETGNIWRNAGGEVYALGKLGGYYLCRVPGRYVSSDIALFRLDGGALARSETVAWAWCDEGWCNQQDAWLADLDGDGRMDIVQRYTLRDDKGKVREERTTVLSQQENGAFDEVKNAKPDTAKYPMAKI